MAYPGYKSYGGPGQKKMEDVPFIDLSPEDKEKRKAEAALNRAGAGDPKRLAERRKRSKRYTKIAEKEVARDLARRTRKDIAKDVAKEAVIGLATVGAGTIARAGFKGARTAYKAHKARKAAKAAKAAKTAKQSQAATRSKAAEKVKEAAEAARLRMQGDIHSKIYAAAKGTESSGMQQIAMAKELLKHIDKMDSQRLSHFAEQFMHKDIAHHAGPKKIKAELVKWLNTGWRKTSKSGRPTPTTPTKPMRGTQSTKPRAALPSGKAASNISRLNRLSEADLRDGAVKVLGWSKEKAARRSTRWIKKELEKKLRGN